MESLITKRENTLIKGFIYGLLLSSAYIINLNQKMTYIIQWS